MQDPSTVPTRGAIQATTTTSIHYLSNKEQCSTHACGNACEAQGQGMPCWGVQHMWMRALQQGRGALHEGVEPRSGNKTSAGVVMCPGCCLEEEGCSSGEQQCKGSQHADGPACAMSTEKHATRHSSSTAGTAKLQQHAQ